jgi:signal transduction histidine kinase
MPLSTTIRHEDLVASLVHDLRQPLGNIETIVYLLNMVTPPDDRRVHAQLHAIEGQLRDATRLLTEASATLRRMRPQRVPEAENLDLTNPVTVAVT